MFIEPLFTLILADFVTRLCNLRNEKQITVKIKPLTKFVGILSVLRLVSLLPDLFYFVDRAILISYEGGTHYKMTSEWASYYQLMDLVFISMSLLLTLIITVWLKT
jgi:hypothetical protein